MAKKTRAQQIVPMIRGAFIRAAKALEDEGRPLSEIIKEQLEEKPLDTIKAIAHFVPKEMLIEKDINIQVSELSEEALTSEIRRLISDTAALPVVTGEAEAIKH